MYLGRVGSGRVGGRSYAIGGSKNHSPPGRTGGEIKVKMREPVEVDAPAATRDKSPGITKLKANDPVEVDSPEADSSNGVVVRRVREPVDTDAPEKTRGRPGL